VKEGIQLFGYLISDDRCFAAKQSKVKQSNNAIVPQSLSELWSELSKVAHQRLD
jgi:hypothetical protein